MNEAETFTFRTADLLIELATPGDYERVGELTAQSYFAAGHFETPEHDYLQFVRKVQERAEQSEIYVARRQGEIIGSMTLIQVGADYADIALPGELEIRMLSVDPAAQPRWCRPRPGQRQHRTRSPAARNPFGQLDHRGHLAFGQIPV